MMKQHYSGDPAYEVPNDSALARRVCDAAGCNGRVFIDVQEMHMWLTDTAGIILFRCPIILGET